MKRTASLGIFVVALASLIVGSPIAAQTTSSAAKAAPLTIEDVISLKKSGMNDDLLVGTIKKADKNFVINAASMKALLDAQISPKVMAAILDMPYEEPKAAAPSLPETGPAKPTPQVANADRPLTEEEKEAQEDANWCGGNKGVAARFRWAKNIVRKCPPSTATPESTGTAATSTSPATPVATDEFKKLDHGQPAPIATTLSPDLVRARIREFLTNRDILGDRTFLRVEATDDGIKTSDWNAEHGCDGSPAKCRERVDIVIGPGQIHILVSEMYRNRLSSKWNEKGPQRNATIWYATRLKEYLAEPPRPEDLRISSAR